MIYTAIIDSKLPSLNDYIRECRANRYSGAEMKKTTEQLISCYIRRLPRFEVPVIITFRWIEENNRRDLDNVAFAKKFILDALVKSGKLKDDNRRYVIGFRDEFYKGKKAQVILKIQEAEE
jgi:Holliday junction resolvase RusA-like endonuclease